MSFRDSIVSSRITLGERFNVLFKRGPNVDEDFWDDLEEALILSDVGPRAACEIVESLQERASREALPDVESVLALLADAIAGLFSAADPSPFDENPVCVLFVGINGAGKTTTVGKLAKHGMDAGRKPLIGSADTFRAAAIEQLDVWGQRSGVEVVKRERGSDPASVAFACVERAEQLGSDLVLIDTSGRLHTSDELMRELEKVVNVTRKRAAIPVRCVLVIDATTGQNGLAQARVFNEALDLDGVIMTKLDGTARGGIAVAISHELSLPVLGVGVGEDIEDLRPFDAREYAQALFGDMRDGAFAAEAAAFERSEALDEWDIITPEDKEERDRVEDERDAGAGADANDEWAVPTDDMHDYAPSADEKHDEQWDEAGGRIFDVADDADEEDGGDENGEDAGGQTDGDVVQDEPAAQVQKETFGQKMRRWFT